MTGVTDVTPVTVAIMIMAGLILGACGARAVEAWRVRPRLVRGSDGVWRAARRQTHGWGRP